ncbi:MAG: hypothetical protein RSC08_06735 [Oscillospiraceae bacterium]
MLELPLALGIVKHRNAGGTLVHPAPKLPVPLVQSQNRRGIGALGVD